MGGAVPAPVGAAPVGGGGFAERQVSDVARGSANLAAVEARRSVVEAAPLLWLVDWLRQLVRSHEISRAHYEDYIHPAVGFAAGFVAGAAAGFCTVTDDLPPLG